MIVKKLNPAQGELPLGDPTSYTVELDDILGPDKSPIIENPDGTVTVDLSAEGEGPAVLTPPGHHDNLVDSLTEDQLTKIANDVVSGYEADLESTKEWFDMLSQGMDNLGLRVDEKTEPWEGACASKHPLLLEAIVKYQAKARSQLLPAGGPVRTEVIGLKTPDKLDRATRVRQFMNYQVTESITEYVREHDRMLFAQGFSGMAFTKLYYDQTLARPACKYIRAEDFIVNYYATDLETAERYTHKIEMSKNEIKKYQLAGIFAEMELVPPTPDPEGQVRKEEQAIEGRQPPSDSEDQRYTILEQHVLYDLPDFPDVDGAGKETGLALPYIITVEKSSNKVLAIRRNWKEGDPLQKKCLYFVDWPLVPGFGFYGYGYLHLIGALAKTASSTWQQLVDAGTLSNLPGGFVTKGTRMSEPDNPIGPGVWKSVTQTSDDIRKSLMPLPYKEPSQTLLALLERAVEWGKNLADNTEAIIAESTNYGPVGTTMALLDASGKLFSAIHERLFESQKKELRVLGKLNAEYLPDEYPYDVIGGNRAIFKMDFNDFVEILPVTNPRTPSEAHRLAKANAILDVATRTPQVSNLREALTDVYQALGVDDPQRFLTPLPPQATPADPVSENMAVINNLPLKAALYQDHQAHIVVHMSVAQNPIYQNNPVALQALAAHIQEHLGMKYFTEMQLLMQTQLPPPGTPMPPQIENAIAVRAAQAAALLLQKDIVAAQNGQTGQADPMVAIAQKELEIKKEQLVLDAKNNAMDARLKQLELRLEHEDRVRQQDMDLQEAQVTADGRVREEHVRANAEIIKTQILDDMQASETPDTKTNPNVSKV